MAEEAAACVVGADDRVNNAARRAGGDEAMAELQDEVTTRYPIWFSAPKYIFLSFNYRRDHCVLSFTGYLTPVSGWLEISFAYLFFNSYLVYTWSEQLLYW